jgi:chromate transporter
MSETKSVLWQIAANYTFLSLVSIGGILPLIPEIHRQTVSVQGWMTDQRFIDLFAIAQAAPGPGLLFVTLIGWDVAGLPGAAIATISITAPSCTIAFFASRLWHRFRFARWRIIVQNGLVPVTIGLMGASAYIITTAVGDNAVAFALTVTTAVATFLTGVHPVVFLIIGAALGYAGLV